MKKDRWMWVINACILAMLVFGVYFTTAYLSLLFTKELSMIKTILLITVELMTIALFLFMLLKKEMIYKRRKEVLLLVCMSVICVAVLEIGIRLIDDRQPVYSRHPYLNYYPTPNYVSADGLNRHNSLGFRGEEISREKPESTYRIVLLGGSSTYTQFVKDYTKDFASHLENDLNDLFETGNIEVINAGVGGYTSWESLINLQYRVLDLDPDLIIIYHGTNDVHTRLVAPQHYVSDNTGRRKQWAAKSPFSIFNLKLVQKLTQTETDVNFDVDAVTFGATDDPRYSQVLGMAPLEALKRNPPIYFERNLVYMITLAKEEKVNVLLSTWAHSDEMEDYAATEHYKFGFAQNNDVVRKVARDKGVILYDFIKDMPMDQKYWRDGRHVNEEGAALKGKLFAQHIFNDSKLNAEIKSISEISS